MCDLQADSAATSGEGWVHSLVEEVDNVTVGMIVVNGKNVVIHCPQIT